MCGTMAGRKLLGPKVYHLICGCSARLEEELVEMIVSATEAQPERTPLGTNIPHTMLRGRSPRPSRAAARARLFVFSSDAGVVNPFVQRLNGFLPALSCQGGSLSLLESRTCNLECTDLRVWTADLLDSLDRAFSLLSLAHTEHDAASISKLLSHNQVLFVVSLSLP